MTIGASSPPWKRFVAERAFVDSASPGRNDVDSFFSASVNLPGRLAAKEAKMASTQIAATTHLARRPGKTGRRGATRRLLPQRDDAYVTGSSNAARASGSVTGARQVKRSQT